MQTQPVGCVVVQSTDAGTGRLTAEANNKGREKYDVGFWPVAGP